jgi:DNA-binding transcriptional LysR family regulator
MELRHLRYFVAVAEERHFGRAAQRLRIAQPPLSRQIQMLESELGFALFDRSRRKVELTAAGAVLLDHARRIFEAIDLAVHEAARASKGESGRLVVGYPSSLAYSGLTELLRAYRARFPEVEVVLREMPPQHQIDALKRSEIDVGFIRGRFVEPTIASECVRREPLVVALPAEHPLAGRARIKLAQLALDPFVIFPRDRGPVFFDQIVSMCHDAGFTPRITQQAPQLDLVSLVAAGFGVSIVPESLRLLGRDGITFRPLVGAPVSELLAAWRSGEPSPAVHEFVAIVRAHLKGSP